MATQRGGEPRDHVASLLGLLAKLIVSDLQLSMLGRKRSEGSAGVERKSGPHLPVRIVIRKGIKLRRKGHRPRQIRKREVIVTLDRPGG